MGNSDTRQHLNTARLLWTSEDKAGQQPAALQEELGGYKSRAGWQTGDPASCPMHCLPTCSLPLPPVPPPATAAGLGNSTCPEPDKLYLSPKGAQAFFFFCKHMQHKSCLSPSHLTLFSLPPHLLSAKWVNSFSIYCGRIKPRLEQWEGCRTAVPCARCLPEGWALFATLAL